MKAFRAIDGKLYEQIAKIKVEKMIQGKCSEENVWLHKFYKLLKLKWILYNIYKLNKGKRKPESF